MSRFVGLGLDAKYADVYPGGLRNLCQEYGDRLTHLSIVGLSTVEEARWFRHECAKGVPIVHHLSEVEPARVEGPNLVRAIELDAMTREMEAAWCCEDIGHWTIGPYSIPYFAPPLLEAEIADHVAEGLVRLREVLSVPFFAEIPSCSFVAGSMSLPRFFEVLVAKARCPIVLDVSHVYSYALAKTLPVNIVLDSMPLCAVEEIHIAGGHISKYSPLRYVDSHDEIILPEVEELLMRAAVKCPALRCVTYEIGNKVGAQAIEGNVNRIASRLREVGWEPRL